MEKTNLNAKEAAFEYAKQAIPLMARHGVMPTPDNYAIWYTYVAGGNEGLIKEINHLIERTAEFTDTINHHLFSTYVTDTRDRIVRDATDNTHALLGELMGIVSDFSGQTQDYGNVIGGQISKIKSNDGANLEDMARQIIDSAVAMKNQTDGVSVNLLSSQKEISQLKAKLAAVQTESEQDFLTGIHNRKYFDHQLENMVETAKQENTDLCLLLIDIDHFKKFNDHYGHLIGDEVLKIVAKALKDQVKGRDVVARYGGEEFCILLPNTPINGAMSVAEVIRKAIASKELKRRDTGENYGQITVSIGAAMFRHKSDNTKNFVKRADSALYQSKHKGRNCVTMETA